MLLILDLKLMDIRQCNSSKALSISPIPSRVVRRLKFYIKTRRMVKPCAWDSTSKAAHRRGCLRGD